MTTRTGAPTARLLTLRETAEMLAVSEATLYGWRYRGDGPPGFRLNGGRVRYREADVLAWVEQQRDVPRTAIGG